MSSDVSVVIPTYNQSRFLVSAIESALHQSTPPREVIVVDDGSSDETPDVLGSFGDRLAVLRQTNRGVAAARNAGAKLAGGRFLAFLDSDDIWLPRKLERQLSRFGNDPALGLVHVGVEEIDVKGSTLGQRLNGLEGDVADELVLFRQSVILGGGSGALIRRGAFEAAGGFDEKLSTSADWDLFHRVASDWKVGFVPEVLLRYRLHSANMHSNPRLMERDMMLAFSNAFRETGETRKAFRRKCYGNLHRVLAGSFFLAGDYRRFTTHALKSLWLTPENAGYFFSYPVRRLQSLSDSERNAVMQ